jgi:ketosteroid isomerase-like protein
MNRSVFVTATALCLALSAPGCAANGGKARAATTPIATGADMTTSQASTETVKQFFAAFGKGDVEGIVATFAPSATIIAVRAGKQENNEPYGSYDGKEGAREFVANLGRTFDTQAFSVDALIAEGDTAFARGSFTHKVKATGKLYTSDWALTCVVRAGKIVEYRFFEDSASFARANATH